ncbi:MAG: phosphocholine cytidylyltransferase family protein [Deltaproteobacteria bacterium]|nr:MAG: phosphocholine cytidylyltransferase family protein [Deltaproteobacteria bacterium]
MEKSMQSHYVGTAVIMAGGLGLRINQHIDNKPKGFIDIDGVTLIERSINIMKKHGIRRFIIGTGYQSPYYEKLAEKIPHILLKKNPIYARTSSFYTLFNLRELITEDFLLLESDLLFEEKAIQYLQQHNEKNVVLASGRTHSRDEVYIETDDRGILVKMSKDREMLGRVDGELVGITRLSLQRFQQICAAYQADESTAEKIDYETALTTISATHPIRVDRIEDLIWTEIDMVSHLDRAKNTIYPRIKQKETGRT